MVDWYSMETFNFLYLLLINYRTLKIKKFLIIMQVKKRKIELNYNGLINIF